MVNHDLIILILCCTFKSTGTFACERNTMIHIRFTLNRNWIHGSLMIFLTTLIIKLFLEAIARLSFQVVKSRINPISPKKNKTKLELCSSAEFPLQQSLSTKKTGIWSHSTVNISLNKSIWTYGLLKSISNMPPEIKISERNYLDKQFTEKNRETIFT